MNKCFFIGKIISDPIFEFLYMNDNISICYFFLELIDKTVISIYATDVLADFIYQNLNINNFVSIEAVVCNNSVSIFSAKITQLKKL